MTVVTENVPEQLCGGMARLAAVLARTFGPTAASVIVAGVDGRCESLTSSGPIARRIVEISGRPQNSGAMLLRQAVWRMHDGVGDGGAMTAILTHALVRDGLRLVNAGLDASAVRRGLELGLATVADSLTAQSLDTDAATLLRSAFGENDLTSRLSEMCTDLGPDGYVDIREGVGPGTTYRMIPGARFSGSTFTPDLRENPRREFVLTDPYVLVTDQDITDPRSIAPVLDAVLDEDGGPLLVVAKSVTGSALRMLCRNRKVLPVAACRLAAETHWRGHLEDLAFCTRARLIGEHAGARLSSARIDDLGYAQHVRLRADTIEVLGGAGDAHACAARRGGLRRSLADEENEAERDTLRRRIGNLTGRTAVLRLGAVHDIDRATARVTAERAIRLAATAPRGAVPGGGAALVHCRRRLDALCRTDPAEAAGVRLLRGALDAPLCRIARERPGAAAAVRQAGTPYGYDVTTDRILDMCEHRIVDSAAVVLRAVQTAVSLVGTVLTTKTLVLRETPEISLEP